MLKLILSLFIITATAHATTPIEQLPFGIEIGKTLSRDVADRGNCTKTHSIGSSRNNCHIYTMPGGFKVYVSQDGVVNKLYFSQKNRLPRAWREIGLSLDTAIEECTHLDSCPNVEAQMGMNFCMPSSIFYQFCDVIPYTFTSGKISTTPSIGWRKYSFALGNYYYEFKYWTKGLSNPPKNLGEGRANLESITITEDF